MSDRLYLSAVPNTDAGKIRALLDEQPLLPYEPIVVDGVLHVDGSPRANPRYAELWAWAGALPDIHLGRPERHLSALFWKLREPEQFRDRSFATRATPPLGGSMTLAYPAQMIAPLINKHVDRAARTHECAATVPSELNAFLRAHSGDHVFLIVC
jgi:hypothetical protein